MQSLSESTSLSSSSPPSSSLLSTNKKKKKKKKRRRSSSDYNNNGNTITDSSNNSNRTNTNININISPTPSIKPSQTVTKVVPVSAASMTTTTTTAKSTNTTSTTNLSSSSPSNSTTTVIRTTNNNNNNSSDNNIVRNEIIHFQQNLPVYTYKEQILQAIFGGGGSSSTKLLLDINNREQKQQQQVQSPHDTTKNNTNKKPKYKNIPTKNNSNNNNKNNNQQHYTNNKIVIISAETGSGKSTQIPAYCLLYDNNVRIAVTQPRRVAAITLAQRVSYEYSVIIRNNTNNNNTTTTNNNNNVLGNEIGYRVRFDDRTNRNNGSTRLIYITDGMLLRECMVDKLLLQYDVLFLDEVHERSVATDILLGIIKNAYNERNIINPYKYNKPLRIIIMSATIQVSIFANYFNNNNVTSTTNNGTTNTKNNDDNKMLTTIDPKNEANNNNNTNNNVIEINIPGRTYPVEILYTKDNQQDYIEAAMLTILQIHYELAPIDDIDGNDDIGDILVFLPGQEEIEDLAGMLQYQIQLEVEEQRNNNDNNDNNKERIASQWTGDHVVSIQNTKKSSYSNSNGYNNNIVGNVLICVLYAALPPEQQMIAFETTKPVGCKRKIILATTIAETSITIPSIRYVVDTGKHKTRYISNPVTGMEHLTIANISQAQAQQRSGRAGRTGPGYCFRLYTEIAYETQLDVTTPPEIVRVNLCQIILQLKNIGIIDPIAFDYITPPDKSSIVRSCKILFALGALDGTTMQITDHGRNLAKLPLDPIFAHLVLQSITYNCFDDMLTAVSVLSCDHTLFYTPGGSSSTNLVHESNASSSSSSASSKATAAHRRFASYEGDIPTALNVYNAWQKEAIYIPPKSTSGRNNNNNNNSIQQVNSKLLLKHGEWCQRNYISGRALARSYAIREQLRTICYRSKDRGGLGLNTDTMLLSNNNTNEALSNNDKTERFLKCAAAGLFLQAASRRKNNDPSQDSNNSNNKGNGGSRSGWVLGSSSAGTSGKYRTKVGNQDVSIHPTSTLFGRNPPPKCVVYTELVTTKKTYIRGVTQIREEWLYEVAPQFYSM